MNTPRTIPLPPSPPLVEEDLDLITGQMRRMDMVRRSRLEAGRTETPRAAVQAVLDASRALANVIPNEVPMDVDPPFDAAALGLKEMGNLASWTVSSCKPGCGVDALRDEDTGLFWQ